MAKLKPCWKCGNDDITLWDCGYSSFNVSGVKCNNPKCKHEIKVNGLWLNVNEELIKAWNRDRMEFKKRRTELAKQLKAMDKGGGIYMYPSPHSVSK